MKTFDTLATATAQDLKTDVYKGLVAADADIAIHGGITNGFVVSPQMKSELLLAVDANKRPLLLTLLLMVLYQCY